MKYQWGWMKGTLVALAATLSFATQAVTLRIANQGDALAMDPHSLNETLQASILSNVYEPLIARDRNFALTPALATNWQQTSPRSWRFNLRKGVKFHDGTPFTADDVIFSFDRVRGEASDMKVYVAQIKAIKKVDDYTIDIELFSPFTILPYSLTRWLIMSKRWCEAKNAVQSIDPRKGLENAATNEANGTGPFILEERLHDIRSTFVRNPHYWGTIDSNIDKIIFTPMASASARLDALINGKIDLMEPLALSEVARVRNDAKLKVMQGPEQRVIFLGMDQKRDELLYSSVKGKNPFKDLRVRQAFYQAIDIENIRKEVMSGASLPTGAMLASHMNGYVEELDKRLPYDVEAAKKLMAEAGYSKGFDLKMNCPNDRYVNDAAICQTIALDLAKIGVRVSLQAESKNSYFPKLLRGDVSFYLLGWNAATGDVHNVLFSIIASPRKQDGRGPWNFGNYNNPRVDELTDKISSELDPNLRSEMIYEALKTHRDEIGHIPLHRQALTWAMRKSVDAVQWPDNGMPWRYIVYTQ